MTQVINKEAVCGTHNAHLQADVEKKAQDHNGKEEAVEDATPRQSSEKCHPQAPGAAACPTLGGQQRPDAWRLA